MANKLTKKYIGTDQVGSVQLELENNLALRANNVSGVSLDILKIDASNLFQLLQHPYLPGPATAPEQAARQQEVDTIASDLGALELVVDAIQSDVNILISDMSIVQTDISALQSEDLTFLKLDGTRAMTGALAMGGFKISNLADPTLAQDAATKSWVMSQIASGTDFEVQKIILSSSDITNQYIDLSFLAAQGSVICSSSRVNLIVVLGVDADADFRQDNTGAVTRLHFQGPSASAGESSLSAGQILYFNYVKA